MSGVVLLTQGRAALYLSDVQRHADGSVKSGFVNNGCWVFRRDEAGSCGAYCDRQSKKPVNSWDDPGYVEVPAPNGRDYNDVMAKAEGAHGVR